MKDVRGQTAFITGAATGVGYGIAHAFLEAGMNVVVSDIRTEALQNATRELAKVSPNVRGIVVDVTDRDAMASTADEAEAAFGKIHVLVNNAGINVFGPIDEASYDDWDWIMDVNLNSVFNGLKCFLPKIKAHGEGGHVINTASMASLVSGPGAGIYTAAKFAVRGLSECLWYTLKPQGIGVSVVCPGLVASNIHHSEELRPDKHRNTGHPENPEFKAVLERIQPLGMQPLEMGAKVLKGLLDDELYIMTHPEHREEVERDYAEIVAAFPDEEADPQRLEVEHGRQKAKYDLKAKYGKAS